MTALETRLRQANRERELAEADAERAWREVDRLRKLLAEHGHRVGYEAVP